MSQYSEKTLETVKGLRLIDDTLFRLVAARKEACQEILRTLLDDPDLIVIQATPQETVTSIHREIILDVLCQTKDGKIINVEVQKGANNDDVRRCRFHLSSITANKTPKGTSFKDVPDVSIVYITEYDALGNNQSFTCSEMCQKVGDSYVPVSDGAKIYYVNTVIKDNTDKSELMDLFLVSDVFDSKKFPELSKAMKYFKKEEGVSTVCTLVENYAKEYAEEYAKEYAKDQMVNAAKLLIKKDLSDEEISTITQLSIEEIKALRNS